MTFALQAEVSVLLDQAMLKDGARKADLALRRNMHRHEIDRLLDLDHATNLAQVEAGFAAPRTSLKIEVAEAP